MLNNSSISQPAVALITGASAGLGREFARIHAAAGGDVILVARSVDKLKQLKMELENKHQVQVHILVKDLTQPHAPREVYEAVHDRGLSVDYLINNAGFGGYGKFHERKWADDKSMIDLNIVAVAGLTRFFLDDFVARGSGRIMNVSSIASLMPGPLQAMYFATKAFVSSFSQAIAYELRDTGVTVTALLPGPTLTDFGDTSDTSDTSVFDDAADAHSVAKTGYEAMLAGKLDVIAGLPIWKRLGYRLAPIVPKKLIMNTVEKIQSKT